MGVIKVEVVDVMAALGSNGRQVYRDKLDAWRVTLYNIATSPNQVFVNGAKVSPLCDVSGTLGAGNLRMIFGGATGPKGPIMLDDELIITTHDDFERDPAQALILVKEYYVPNRPGPDAVNQAPGPQHPRNAEPRPTTRPQRGDKGAGPVRTSSTFGSSPGRSGRRG